MKLPKTKKEYDKDLENMDTFIGNIESYPPSFKLTEKPIEDSVDLVYTIKGKKLRINKKNPTKTFIGGLVVGFTLGFAIAYAIGATIVFNLLDK